MFRTCVLLRAILTSVPIFPAAKTYWHLPGCFWMRSNSQKYIHTHATLLPPRQKYTLPSFAVQWQNVLHFLLCSVLPRSVLRACARLLRYFLLVYQRKDSILVLAALKTWDCAKNLRIILWALQGRLGVWTNVKCSCYVYSSTYIAKIMLHNGEGL